MFAEEKESERQLFTEQKEGQKQPTKESNTDKERCLLQAPRVVAAEGKGEVGVDAGELEPGVLITSPCDSFSVSEG